MIYFLWTLILFVFIQLYFKVADRYNIIDKPNKRSSHTQITIRGGGIIFPFAVLLWSVFNGLSYPFFLAGLLSIATISFIDDVVTLPNRSRLAVHLISVLLLFYEAGIFNFEWYWWIIALILTIGWINAFNFMDGINGITAFYSISALISFLVTNYKYHFIEDELIWTMSIAVVIFSIYNARKKAKTFAGDVGSVSMAFILGFLMIRLVIISKQWEYILFFSVYGVDAVLTIMHRLIKRENIFEAHRTHLYQYLANERRISHLSVSALYACLQLGVNALLLWSIGAGYLMNLALPVAVLLILIITYIGSKTYILKKMAMN
jgi:UDP-GlcNAc:undecaprenyl-phosphate GlcNAc-1-phosphate transferase